MNQPSRPLLLVVAVPGLLLAGCLPGFIPANRLDADGDGFYSPRVVSDLAGDTIQDLVADQLDCDDSRDDVFPGAAELCDGLDNDCDRAELCAEAASCPEALHATERDDDGDGFSECGFDAVTGAISVESQDCNDDPDGDGAFESPGLVEICAMPFVEGLDGPGIYDPNRPQHGLDDDCDGGPMDGEVDDDLDGHAEGCELVGINDPMVAPLGIDCDDTDATINPSIGVEGTPVEDVVVECVADPDIGATNCDVEAVVERTSWFPDCDMDADGNQQQETWLYLCADETPAGQEIHEDACIFNGIMTLGAGNWIDGGTYADRHNDCNDHDSRLNGLDLDGDLYSTCQLDYYPGLASADGEPYAFPGACEACDLIDNDLDGEVDEESDDDGDGAVWSYPFTLTDGCTADPYVGAPEDKTCDYEYPPGYGNFYPDSRLDCDDTDATKNMEDIDGDGVSSCAGDCADGDPWATNEDNDGDGSTTCDDPPDCDDNDATAYTRDDDGDGFTTCQFDCLDTLVDDPATSENEALLSADVWPGQGVQCDGWWDSDCDGFTDPLEFDGDSDGTAECDGDCDDANPAMNAVDADSDGWTTCEGDCDDAVATVFPGAAHLCDGVLDNDCSGGPDPNEANADNDGSSTCDGDCNDFDATVDAADLDSDGWTTCEGDCNDGSSALHPGIDADGDGWDACGSATVPADCSDSSAQLNWNDADGDASSTCSTVADCDDQDAAENQLDVDSDGQTTCAGDCDDSRANVKTTGLEGSVADGLDNDCDGVADEAAGLVAAGHLAITEIMIGTDPQTGDGYGEYVEVKNTTTHQIDLRGWEVDIVNDATATTTTFAFPSGVDEAPVLVPAGARFVLARPTNDLAYGNDIADAWWSVSTFSDVGGTISLVFAGVTPNVTVDVVDWTPTGCVSGCTTATPTYGGPSYWRPGYAMGLKETYVGNQPATNNDAMSKWCQEGNPLGPHDHGSPGTAPTVLGPCGSG